MEPVMLTVGGADLEVVRLDGREAVSELFELSLIARVAPGESVASPKAMVGEAGSVALRDGFENLRTITGVVAEASLLSLDDGGQQLHVTLRPQAFMATLGRGCRCFQDADVVAAVDNVLGGIPHRWELTGSYPVHEYVAQYREDDWTFVSRWLEQEGIHYWFDHAAGSMLVLSDDSTSSPALPGGAAIPFRTESGMTADFECIVQLGSAGRVVPSTFTVAAFDKDRPHSPTIASSGSGPLEIYDAPGGGLPSTAAARAAVAAGGAGAAKAGVSGEASVARIAPGYEMAVTEHPLGRLNAPYFLTEVSYQVRQRRRDDDSSEPSYQCFFTGIAKGTPYRPPADTPPAQQAGLQTAIVVGPPGEEIHIDETGQVRVQLHWDREGGRDDRAGKWMRVAQRGTTESMLLPRIGWNILTFNEEGAVDAPAVLSRLHDAEHPPAYPLPGNKTRVVFKTATTPADGSFNEIYFEDKKGSEEMFINASKDMNILVQRNKTNNVRRDSLLEVANDRSIVVTDNTNEGIVGNQTLEVGANDTTTIGGGRVKEVGGNETHSIASKRTVKTGDGHSIAVLQNRTVSVGAAMIETSLGGIDNKGELVTLLAGGAVIRATPATITENCGGVGVQAIGGAKLEMTKAQRTLDVGEQFFETVGGVLLCKTGDTYTDGASTVATWTVGAKLSSAAPEIHVEATERIELVCGASSIVILPDSVEVTSTELDLSGSKHVTVETKKVEHNA